MKLSDFVIHYLADLGIKHVFVVTGGYAVNLIDSFFEEPRMHHIPVHHEQVAAMAAEGYARFNGLGAVITTNAPGALNLLNGISGAYNDSIPVIFICGQVNRSRWNRAKGDPAGREVVDIVTIVQSLTKYAQYVEDPNKIRFYLEQAVHMATSGRPGPVLLDIPLDVQKAEIKPENLSGLEWSLTPQESSPNLDQQIQEAWSLVQKAKRPVLLLGGGINISKTQDQARYLVEKLQIPTVVTWSALDVLPYHHHYYCGNIGSYGNRRANFTIQNSDLVLALGARLNVRHTGGEPETFAPEAAKIMVDIDRFEIDRCRVKIDLPIHSDLRTFLSKFIELPIGPLSISPWLSQVSLYRGSLPDVLETDWRQEGSVNVYVFMKALSARISYEVPVVTDCGGNLIWTMQAYQVQNHQRVFSNMGLSSMGYSLAASIGVCLATDRKPVVCIIGDGGLQVHIQELQTIRYHNLPIKIFVINNRSYGIIKQTIESWMEDSKLHGNIAVSGKDGYSTPDFEEIAHAYNIPDFCIHNQKELIVIQNCLTTPGPVLCNVMLDEDQRIAPRLEFGRSLEDQHPLLDREILEKLMLVKQRKSTQKEREGI
ncbi:thiamine pyrophosphate-binding protein [Candidatus Parcubacteria bacterium]|nr:thiamine pyrophosphate-binding protein [Candidatus Parcubacteria bacterium]